jgi:glucose uptake protein
LNGIMIAPQSPVTAFILLVLSVIFWGSWSNTIKCSKGVRYEIYYWDFIIGALLTGTILGLIFGKYGYGHFQNLFENHFRYIVQAFLSGVLFNMANILLVAAVTIAGMTFSYVMCFSATLIVDTLMRYVIDTHANKVSLFIGILFLIIGVLFAISSYKKLPHKPDVLRKVISITLFSGLMLGLFYPLLGKSLDIPSEYHLGPYASFFFFSVGLFVCNLAVNWFLMRKPLFGHPLSYQDYRAATWRNHGLAWAGGCIWSLAMCFRVLSGKMVNPIFIFFFIQVVALFAAIWGLFLWKEYPKDSGSRPLLAFCMLAYCIGVTLIGIAEFS